MWPATRPQLSAGTSFDRVVRESNGASRPGSPDRNLPSVLTSLCRQCDGRGFVQPGRKLFSEKATAPRAGKEFMAPRVVGSASRLEASSAEHRLRRRPSRLRLRGSDRALLVWMTRLWPGYSVWPGSLSRLRSCGGIGPASGPIGWKSRGRAGRPRITRELRDLIRRMNAENPLWRAPRIHRELLKLGFEVAASTVSKYMIRRRGPPSQSWRTFLRNHAEAIAAIDLCVVLVELGANISLSFV